MTASTTRIAAASVALALGVSALAAPTSHAASVSAPDKEGICKITYTDAEKKRLDAVPVKIADAYLSFELEGSGIHDPEAVDIVREFSQTDSGRALAVFNELSGDEKTKFKQKIEQDIKPFVDRLMKATGEGEDTARMILAEGANIHLELRLTHSLTDEVRKLDSEEYSQAKALLSMPKDQAIEQVVGVSEESFNKEELERLNQPKYQGVINEYVEYLKYAAGLGIQCTDGKGVEYKPAITDPGTDKPSTDKPSTDKPSTDKPSTDKPSTDKPSTDKPSTDKPSTDKPSTDKPGTDKPGTDKPSTDKPSTDKPSTDKPSTDKPSTDKSSTDKPSTDKPSTDKSSTDKPSTDKPSTDKPSTDNPGKGDEPSDGTREKKELTPEEILGIVIGTLFGAGGLAIALLFVVKQMGFNLPFALPQLPF